WKPEIPPVRRAPSRPPTGFPKVFPPLPAVEWRAPPPVKVTEAGPPRTNSASAAVASTRFVKALSYSGPGGGVHVEADAQTGKRPYIDDDDARFEALPELLKGHDYVQASNADRSYSAVDLMEDAVKPDSIISVAHDGRHPRPEWLTRQFKPTNAVVAEKGKPMQVFQRRADRE